MFAVLLTGGVGLTSCSILHGISRTPQASPQCFTVMENNMIIPLQKNTKLTKAGESLKLSYIDRKSLVRIKVLIIHINGNLYQAYENKCSLCGNELEYDSTSGILNCCSIARSKFNIRGEVIKGPARENLRLFPTMVSGNDILINLA